LLERTPAAASDRESLVLIRIEAMRESLERIGRFDPARARERLESGFVPPVKVGPCGAAKRTGSTSETDFSRIPKGNGTSQEKEALSRLILYL
jgi:hypothetical protein